MRLFAAAHTMLPVMKDLQQHGYVLLAEAGWTGLKDVVAELGEVIQVTEVKNDPDTPALVTSARALDFHTDHPKADYIAWLCIEQAAQGGESILADAEMAFARLAPDEQSALSEIHLLEHQVFPDDKDSHPLVAVGPGGRRRFYYSFWLVKDELPPRQASALQRFRRALPECQVAEVKLQPNDLLIVDNTRIFHGRRAFAGDSRRLVRHWIRRRDLIDCRRPECKASLPRRT